jgi:hypothetical protein
MSDTRLTNAINLGRQKYEATIVENRQKLHDWIDERIFVRIAETESLGRKFFDFERDKIPKHSLIDAHKEALNYIRQIEGLDESYAIGLDIQVRWPNVEVEG